jgi:hypothetical protein
MYCSITYHQLEGNLESFLAFLKSMYHRPTQGLDHDQSVKCDADAMMWVGERPFAPNSLKSKYDSRGRQQDGQDLQPDVES